MGGVAPLGYDVRDRQLIINPAEAKVVSEIFIQYLSLGSVAALKQYLDQKKLRTKVRTSAHGRCIRRQALLAGRIVQATQQRAVHRQDRPPRRIARVASSRRSSEPRLWEKVKALLAANNQGHRQPGRRVTTSVLAGLVFDAEGNRYTPTHAVKKGRRYRYYTSQAVIQKRRKPSHLDRIPARELEQLVFSRIQIAPKLTAGDGRALYLESALLTSDLGRLIEAAQAMAEKWSELTSQQSTELLRGVVRRIVLRGSELEIEVDLEALASRLLHQGSDGKGDEASKAPQGGNHLITLKCSFTSRAAQRASYDWCCPDLCRCPVQSPSPLLKAIVTAHGWRERIIAGEIYSDRATGLRSQA